MSKLKEKTMAKKFLTLSLLVGMFMSAPAAFSREVVTTHTDKRISRQELADLGDFINKIDMKDFDELLKSKKDLCDSVYVEEVCGSDIDYE